jgi:hypothetical protein
MLHHAISALMKVLRPDLDLSKSRLETLCVIVIGMVSARSVNLSHIACERPGSALTASTYRRLQRFFQHIRLEEDWALPLLVRLLGLRIRQRQTVILSSPSRAASARHDPGFGPSMSSTTWRTFSGRRTRASAVPVADENVRPHPLQRCRRRPVRVEPQRCSAPPVHGRRPDEPRDEHRGGFAVDVHRRADLLDHPPFSTTSRSASVSASSWSCVT